MDRRRSATLVRTAHAFANTAIGLPTALENEGTDSSGRVKDSPDKSPRRTVVDTTSFRHASRDTGRAAASPAPGSTIATSGGARPAGSGGRRVVSRVPVAVNSGRLLRG